MAQAVLDLALNRGTGPELSLSLALPTMAGYIGYLQRLHWFLAAARISVYLVSQDGRVTIMAPGAAPVSAVTTAGAGTSTRRKLGLSGSSRLQLPLLHSLIAPGARHPGHDASCPYDHYLRRS
ncbi:MAG TPA: hypothetical protein VND68_02945 [Chloroflexia bacterium]|jgi:hypothetical protein|nr:hypothetical protein [Chloroflexia bacterium]